MRFGSDLYVLSCQSKKDLLILLLSLHLFDYLSSVIRSILGKYIVRRTNTSEVNQFIRPSGERSESLSFVVLVFGCCSQSVDDSVDAIVVDRSIPPRQPCVSRNTLCCHGPTNGVVKAGHRHGATPLVVRAFEHPWCLVQTEGRYVIGAGSGLIIRAPSV
jgi:hypothetical protein